MMSLFQLLKGVAMFSITGGVRDVQVHADATKLDVRCGVTWCPPLRHCMMAVLLDV